MSELKTKCDFCAAPAKYDGKTQFGPWANMCETCFNKLGVKTKGLYSELHPEPVTKLCIVCSHNRPLSEFMKTIGDDGKPRYHAVCRQCQERARRKW